MVSVLKKLLPFLIVLLLFCNIGVAGTEVLGGEIRFIPPEGLHHAPLKVRIEVSPFRDFHGKEINAVVFYSLDGRIPDRSSLLYTNEILLEKPGMIKIQAMAFGQDEGTRGRVYAVVYKLIPANDSHGEKEGKISLNDTGAEQNNHHPGKLENEGYSAVFNGDAYLSEVLLFRMGVLVLKFMHPMSHHRHTVMIQKKTSDNGDVQVLFDTEYRSWRNAHHMKWSLVFNKYNIPKDIRFISDSGTFKTGMVLNRIKGNILRDMQSVLGRAHNR